MKLLCIEIYKLVSVVEMIQTGTSSSTVLEAVTRAHLESCLKQTRELAKEVKLKVESQLCHSKTGKTSRLKYLWKDVTGDLQRFRQQLTTARESINQALLLDTW